MRMTTARSLAADYRAATLSARRKIITKFWESDGLDGLDTLAYLTGESVDQLASVGGLTRNVARARARRESPEKRRPRQPIPRGFRREARDVAEQAAHGRGFIPKRHWEPLNPTR